MYLFYTVKTLGWPLNEQLELSTVTAFLSGNIIKINQSYFKIKYIYVIIFTKFINKKINRIKVWWKHGIKYFMRIE